MSSDNSPSTFPLRDKVYAAAPYWADVFTERGGNIWYRLTSDNVTMYAITRDIKRAFPRYNEFTSSWAVIVTWDGVTFFSASDAYTRQVNLWICPTHECIWLWDPWFAYLTEIKGNSFCEILSCSRANIYTTLFIKKKKIKENFLAIACRLQKLQGSLESATDRKATSFPGSGDERPREGGYREKSTGTIGHFGKDHNTTCFSPQILVKQRFQFLLGKAKTMLKQNLGRQTKNIMVFSEMAN